MMEWKKLFMKNNEKTDIYSDFDKVILPSGNIHYAKYVKPGQFISGHARDYRNGIRYPIKWPIKYIYLFALNKKWEPDEKVKEDDWPNGI
jgi:hypothetical protein